MDESVKSVVGVVFFQRCVIKIAADACKDESFLPSLREDK